MSGREDRELAELGHLLEALRFSPRASLGAEIMGRWRRGERSDAMRERGSPRLRFLIATGLLALGAIAVLPAGSTRTIDRCCLDLDGGGERDDGLVVVARRGTDVRRLAVYEDRDGSRSYTSGDVLRFERRGRPGLAGAVPSGSRAVEFCCLDYDGGGPPDDALVVVGQAPDRITMAAIYERSRTPGSVSPLR